MHRNLAVSNGTPDRWKNDPKNMQQDFKAVHKEENKHLLKIVATIYRFFELMARGNWKIGVFIASYLPLFFLQVTYWQFITR